MTSHRQNVGWAVAFGALFATVELLGAALRAHYTVYQIVWMRYGVHLVLVIALLGRHDPSRVFHTRSLPRQIWRSLLMLAMPIAGGLALSRGDPIPLVAGLAATPALVLLLLRFGLRRRIDAYAWTCALLSASAGLLMVRHHLDHGVSLILPLVSALCLAVYAVETAQLQNEPVLANLLHTAFWVFLVLTPLQGRIWVTPPAHDLLVVAAIGIVGLIGLLALDHMMRGPNPVPGTVWVNMQALVPVGLLALHTRAVPPPAILTAILLMGAAGALSWHAGATSASAEVDT